MSIRVTCPSCKTAYAVPEEHRGKKLRCKKCQHVFRIEARPVDTERLNPVPATPRPDLDFQAQSAGLPASTRQPKPEKPGISPILLIGGALAALLLLGGGVVGAYFLLKGPDAVAEKPGTGKSGPESANTGGAGTEVVAHNEPGKKPGFDVATGKIDTAYLADDFFIALVVQPSQLAKSPTLAGLPQEQLLGDLIKQTGFDPRKVSHVSLAMDPAPKVQAGPHSPAVIARFQEPIDGRKLLEPLMGPFTEKQHEGKTYLISAAVGATYLPDNRTIVIAPEATLFKMMAAHRGGAGPLAKKLAALDSKSDVLGVFLTEPARAMLGDMMKEVPKDLPPQFAGVTALPDRVDAAVLKLNLAGASLLDVRFETKNAEASAELQKMLQAGVEMLSQFSPLMQQGIQKDAPPPLAPALAGVFDQVVKGIVVKAEGNQTSLTVKMPQGLPELIAKAGPMLGEMVASASAPPTPPSGVTKVIEKPGVPTKDPGRPPFEKSPPAKTPDESPFDDPGRPPFEKSPPTKEPDKPAFDKSNRAQALEWIRSKNAFGPDHQLVKDAKAHLDSLPADRPGFFYELGPDLVKSKKPTWLLGWHGEFLVFELSPEQGARIDKNNMKKTALNALNDLGLVKQDFQIDKPIFDGGPRLPLNKEVMGRLPFRNLGRKSEDYLSIRLVYWDGKSRVIEYSHYLSKFVTKEDKEFRFKYAAPHVQGPGPVLFIFDIVEFDNEKRTGEPLIVSNPVVVLVDITAAK